MTATSDRAGHGNFTVNNPLRIVHVSQDIPAPLDLVDTQDNVAREKASRDTDPQENVTEESDHQLQVVMQDSNAQNVPSGRTERVLRRGAKSSSVSKSAIEAARDTAGCHGPRPQRHYSRCARPCKAR